MEIFLWRVVKPAKHAGKHGLISPSLLIPCCVVVGFRQAEYEVLTTGPPSSSPTWGLDSNCCKYFNLEWQWQKLT